MRPLSPRHARLVQRLIDEQRLAYERRRIDERRLLAQGAPVPDDGGAWECLDEQGALPLVRNEVYLWALRPDGVVVCMDHEAFLRPTEPEERPLFAYAALRAGALRHPELLPLLPPPPRGTEACDHCGGTRGSPDSGAPSCGAPSCVWCSGLGWRRAPVPLTAWLDGIDRGDVLELRGEDEALGLVAGRLAHHYVTKEGAAYWSMPVGQDARDQLQGRLARYMEFHYAEARPAWRPNPTPAGDPFDSPFHVLEFAGEATGGLYAVEVARIGEERYVRRTTFFDDGQHSDWEPPAEPEERRVVLDRAEALREVEAEMRRSSSPDPFPSVIPRRRSSGL